MDRLKPKRTTRRAQQTKLVNEVKAALQCSTPDLVSLQNVLERLTAYDAELRAINAELDPLIPVEIFENELQTMVLYEDKAIGALSSLRTVIEALKDQCLAPITHNVSTEDSASRDDLQSAVRSGGPRLLKLDITPFRGEISKWLPFWEQFEATIDKNPSLTTTDKFHYLRKYLSGEAASAIANLQTTEACYKDAIDMLRSRFGKPFRIEQEHLFLPPVMPASSKVVF